MFATYQTAAEAYRDYSLYDRAHRAAFDSDYDRSTDDHDTLDRIWAVRQHAQAEYMRLSLSGEPTH